MSQYFENDPKVKSNPRLLHYLFMVNHSPSILMLASFLKIRLMKEALPFLKSYVLSPLTDQSLMLAAVMGF